MQTPCHARRLVTLRSFRTEAALLWGVCRRQAALFRLGTALRWCVSTISTQWDDALGLHDFCMLFYYVLTAIVSLAFAQTVLGTWLFLPIPRNMKIRHNSLLDKALRGLTPVGGTGIRTNSPDRASNASRPLPPVCSGRLHWEQAGPVVRQFRVHRAVP